MTYEEQCVVITVLSFIFFMAIHHIIKPSYIYGDNKNNNLSHMQLNLIYSLMYASSLGIFYLFIQIVRDRILSNKENLEKQSIEPPSFK